MKFIKVENFKNDPEIKIVLLSRPEVKNAFHPEMIAEITDVFQILQHDVKTKVVVLRGEGNVFCAGADLNWMKEMVKYSFDQNVEDSEKLWDMFDAISGCTIPVVGVVQGAVYGGALGLAACCDYVIAERKTGFCFSEVKLGLAPAVISSFVLKKIADSFARPYMLSAEVFSAESAQRIGLVHELVDGADGWMDSMKKFSANGLEAMRETKKLVNQISAGPAWAEQKKLTTKVISERRVGAEAQARLKKFIEKT
jgi:methylglutaconyl-CoA hydratase